MIENLQIKVSYGVRENLSVFTGEKNLDLASSMSWSGNEQYRISMTSTSITMASKRSVGIRER